VTPGGRSTVGGVDDGDVGQASTQQTHEGRSVGETRVNPQQGQRHVVRRRRRRRGVKAEDVELPERPVPGETAAEHGLDVAADVLGGLGDGRRTGEHVPREVEAPVDDPRVAAARLTDQFLGEPRVRDLGRVGRLQRLSGRRRRTVIWTAAHIIVPPSTS